MKYAIPINVVAQIDGRYLSTEYIYLQFYNTTRLNFNNCVYLLVFTF